MKYNRVATLWLWFSLNPEDPELLYNQLEQLDPATLDEVRQECVRQRNELKKNCPELFYPYSEPVLNSDDREQAQSKKDFLDTVLDKIPYE